jgi:dienelactone hydrolase
MAQLNVRETLVDGLREILFDLDVSGERVPGLLILPSDADAPLPLVLIQHPGTSSKEDYFVRDVAMSWAKRGWACAGIDAPLHGDRDVHDPMRLFREPERYPAVRAQFAAEITATIDALRESFLVDIERLGFVGYSMGSMLGVAAVARDGRFKAAAFGLVGEGGLAGSASGTDSDVARLGAVAVRIIGKTHDQLIPKEATEALYAALPGEKDIVWLPGGHFEIGPDVVKAAEEWMLRHL